MGSPPELTRIETIEVGMLRMSPFRSRIFLSCDVAVYVACSAEILIKAKSFMFFPHILLLINDHAWELMSKEK